MVLYSQDKNYIFDCHYAEYVNTEYQYAICDCAECRFPECHYTECHCCFSRSAVKIIPEALAASLTDFGATVQLSDDEDVSWEPSTPSTFVDADAIGASSLHSPLRECEKGGGEDRLG